MTVWAALAILVAGFLAGAINTIVGSGSLITFPTLLAVGLPPVVANVSNTVGLVAGSASGVVGYRRELVGQGRRTIWLCFPAALGSALGAALLLVLPQRVFHFVVPILIAVAVVLVIAQPRLTRHLGQSEGRVTRLVRPAAVFLTAIYGGYFGAAQGVILISLLSLLIDDTLQRLNGLKNVLAAVVNTVAAAYFVVAAHVDWQAALLIAISSVVGAQAGAIVGRRLPSTVLRGVIVTGGIAAIVKLLA